MDAAQGGGEREQKILLEAGKLEQRWGEVNKAEVKAGKQG